MNKILKNSLIISVMMFLPVLHGYGMNRFWSVARKGAQEVGESFLQKKTESILNQGSRPATSTASRVGFERTGFAVPARVPQASQTSAVPLQSPGNKFSPLKTATYTLETLPSNATMPSIGTQSSSGGWSKPPSMIVRGNKVDPYFVLPQEMSVQPEPEIQAAPEPSTQAEVSSQESQPEIIEEKATQQAKQPEQAIILREPSMPPLEAVPVLSAELSTQAGPLIVPLTEQELALSQDLADRVIDATPNDNVQTLQGIDEETGQEITIHGIDIVKAAQELIAYNKRFIPEVDVYRILGLNVKLQPNTEKMIDLSILLSQFEKNMTQQQALALQDAIQQMPLIEGAQASEGALIKSATQKPTIKIQLFVDMDTLGNIVEQTLLQQEMRPIVPQTRQANVSTQALPTSQQKLLMSSQQQEAPSAPAPKKVKSTWQTTNRQNVEAVIRPEAVQEQPRVALTQQTSHIISGGPSPLHEQRRGYFAMPAEAPAMPKRRGRPPKIRTASTLSLHTQSPQPALPIEQAAPVQLPPELTLPQQATPAQPQGASSSQIGMPQEITLQSMTQPQLEIVTTEPGTGIQETEFTLEEQRRGHKRSGRGMDIEIERDVRPEKRARTTTSGRSGGTTTVGRVNGRTAGALPMPRLITGPELMPPFGPIATPEQLAQEVEVPRDLHRLRLQDYDLPEIGAQPRKQQVPEPIQPPVQEIPVEQPAEQNQENQPEPPAAPKPKRKAPPKKKEQPPLPKQEEKQEKKKEEPKKEKPKPRQTGSPMQIPEKKEKKEQKPKSSSTTSQAPAPRYTAPEPYQPPSYPEYYGDMSGPIRFSPLPPVNVVLPKPAKKEPKVNEWQERSPQSKDHTYVELKTPTPTMQATHQSRSSYPQRAMRFVIPNEQEEVLEEAPVPATQGYSFGDYVEIVLYVVTGVTATLSGAYLIRWLILRSRG